MQVFSGSGGGHVPSRRPAPKPRPRPAPQHIVLAAYHPRLPNPKIPSKFRARPHPHPSFTLPSVGRLPHPRGPVAVPVGGHTGKPPVSFQQALQAQKTAAASAPAVRAPGTIAPYVNPFGGIKGLVPERVDQGVDLNAPAGSVIRALGAGRITLAMPTGSGWRSPLNTQAFVAERLSAGPLRGQTIYTAEDFTPLVRTGQAVKAGQPIGKFLASGTGIETGFGTSPPGQALAYAKGQSAAGIARGDPGAFPTGIGVAFNNLLKRLGGTGGVLSGPIQGAIPVLPPIRGHVSVPPAPLPSHLGVGGPFAGTPIAGGGHGGDVLPPVKPWKGPKGPRHPGGRPPELFTIQTGPLWPRKVHKVHHVNPPTGVPVGTSTTGTTGSIKSKLINLPASLTQGGAVTVPQQKSTGTLTWVLLGGAALVVILLVMDARKGKGKSKGKASLKGLKK